MRLTFRGVPSSLKCSVFESPNDAARFYVPASHFPTPSLILSFELFLILSFPVQAQAQDS